MSSSDSQRWQRVSALLDEALELPPEARAAWLDDACGDDAALRKEVEELLAADDTSGDFLEDATAIRSELLRDRAESRATARIGERVGAFRLVREIGRGGMGTVYLAERSDGQFEQRVAVKLLQSAPHDQRLLAGFLRERQILARLEHPNIARLIDGGLTDDDVPYLVMEYVEGLPITSFGDSIDEKLRIFLAACSAVEAAHRAHVVHRDLKPSNILVTESGEVKLLDFGIARRIDGDVTQTLAPALTPAYAAPEQLRGEPATPATDVYALGLLLYEMLTGTRVQRAEAIAQTEPPLPSVAAQRRELRGDLDRITMKAIEQNPAHRYASVAALAADVERHLAGEPITARGGLAYRAARGLRRRRFEAATVVLAIVVVAVVVFVLRGRSRAPEAPLRFELLSTFGGSPRQPSLSPDGRQLAFIQEDAAGVPQVFVRSLAGGPSLQLTSGGSLGARSPRWSAGGTIVYDVPGEGIRSVPAKGGAPRQLVAAGFHPSLSRDGRWLLYQHESTLYIAHGDGSGRHPITGVRFHFAFTQADAALSPDGSLIAYAQDGRSPVNTDLYVAPVGGGAARRLTFDDVLVADPVWTPDGKTIYFSSQRSGSLTLWRIAAAGGTPRAVTSGSGEDSESTISADGRRLLYTNARASYALSWLDPATAARRTLREERTPLTHPGFSPDGKRITFFRHRQSDEIFTMAADGSDERQLTTAADGSNVLPDYSFDGRTVFFYRLAPKPAFVSVPAGGGPLTTVLSDFPLYDHIGTQIDPSGRRAMYPNMSYDQIRNTVVRDLASGREQPLGTPLAWPRWSPDGKWVAGASALNDHETVCPADGSRCRAISARGGDTRWSGGWVYFAQFSNALGEADLKPIEIRRVRPDGSREELVATLPGADPVQFFYDVSPRGDIVWCELRQSPPELWMATLP